MKGFDCPSGPGSALPALFMEGPGERQRKWDLRFLKLARDWSTYSKDPSTQTGAVVVRPDLSIAAGPGYNGFPPGVIDTPERYADRDLKYKLIIHCTTPDHRTLTKDLRWVELGSLKVGDELVAFDEEPLPGKRARDYKTAVVQRIEFAMEPVFRVILDNEEEIVTTAEHRWLTTPLAFRTWRWTRTDQLRSAFAYGGRWPTRAARILPLFEGATDYDSGWLAGLLDGEGSLGANTTLHFSQRPGIVLDTALDLLAKKARPFSLRLVSDINAGGLGRKDCLTVHIRGPLAERLAFLGSLRPKRLLGKLDPDTFGRMNRLSNGNESHEIGNVIPAGIREIVKVTTSTGTLFIDGYPMHNCEINAMDSSHEPLTGYTLYTWPFASCSRCATQVIKRGIKRCVAPEIPERLQERWAEDMALTQMMYREVGVRLCLYPWEELAELSVNP